MLVSVLLIVAIAVGIILLISLKDKDKAGWVQFYARGKDSGFSFKEIDLLHKLAKRSKLEDPTALFFSQEKLDACIKSLVKSFHLSGTEADKENQDFLSKLYEYRKKIEMEKPRIKRGIANTRQISDGQNLRILIEGVGVFKSQIIKNNHQFIVISKPMSEKLVKGFSWHGQAVSIYFWRDEDAGYVFDTVVEDEIFSNGLSSLKIAHSDSLFRTQKRKSVRVRMHKPAFLYPITNEDKAGTLETEPGLKCFLEDLSDSGCAVTIGGKASSDMRLKIQFNLGSSMICMSGTVRSVQFKEEHNKSLVHVEADPLPIEVRNKILGEVFGMLPENEEDLPFRLLGEEAEKMTAEASKAEEAADKDILDMLDEDEDGDEDTDKVGVLF